MEKVSDADVARLAKQASDISCFGAVVNMKVCYSGVSCVGSAADRALSFLLGKQPVVSSVGHSESPFEVIVSFFLRIGFIPSSVVVTVLLWVFLVQFSHDNDAAYFAVALQAVMGVLVFVKLVSWFNLLAPRAVLVRSGVAFELGHVFHPPGEDGRIQGSGSPSTNWRLQ